MLGTDYDCSGANVFTYLYNNKNKKCCLTFAKKNRITLDFVNCIPKNSQKFSASIGNAPAGKQCKCAVQINSCI